MLGNGHVRFGRRAAETDQSKDRHRAAARPHTHWSGSEDDPHLHGYLPAPPGRPQRSVTRNGWCPAASHTNRPQQTGNHVAGWGSASGTGRLAKLA